MHTITFEITGDEGVMTLDDMGEGSIVLSNMDDAGKLVRLFTTYEELAAAMETVRPRYGQSAEDKNTDPRLELVA